MGANILNMGLLTVAVGYGFYRSVLGKSQGTKLTIAGIAAWISVMTGALATSLELWLSGTARLNIVVPAMLGVHTLIGVGEALITVAALTFIFQTRPDLIDENSASASGSRNWVIAGILVTLLVLFLSPLASINPDGLNRVAADLGFSHAAQAHTGPLSGYGVPFLQSVSLSKIAAGGIGVAVVGVVIVLLGQGMKAKS
jgi:cobalt/nickel transport system permease protein